MKKILDACCGGRSFWFDKNDEKPLYGNQRGKTHFIVFMKEGDL